MSDPDCTPTSEPHNDVARLSLESLTRCVSAYTLGCVRNEPLLTTEDARDLCSDVVSAVWPLRHELRYPLRYARRATRFSVIRFLKHKRQRRSAQYIWCQDRTAEHAITGSMDLDGMAPARPRRSAFVHDQLRRQDGVTQLILHLRYESNYSWLAIAEAVGGSAASVRMKEKRFRQRTRSAWEARILTDGTI